MDKGDVLSMRKSLSIKTLKNNIQRLLSLVILLVTVITVAVSCTPNNSDPAKSPSYLFNTPGATPQATPEKAELTYTDITLLNAGDIMYHGPQLNSAYNSSTGKYDFSDNFQYMKSIVSAADYAVANFETTTANQIKYESYPSFNSPLETLTSIKDTGYDMLLFANNHCYDKKKDGFVATLNQFKNFGFDYIGGKLSEEEKSYMVKDVNGIKLGMMNYADTLTSKNGQYYTINGITINDGCDKLMDIYMRNEYEKLYSEVSERIADMKEQGADIIIMYIHWGDEYKLEPVSSQTIVAQKLCDLGVDVIIGGHPHVIEPMEILTSQTNPEHSTICFYSLGNYISNQNRLTLSNSNKQYTENGLTVTLTIRKYSTGDVFVKAIDYTPTWVHRYYCSDGYNNYNVVPLRQAIANPDSYGLYNSSFGLEHAKAALALTDPVFEQAVMSYNTSMADEISVFSQAYDAN
ncbi:MAG: CapA family protein [Ruminococcaceae bacterium]|nr:CapA family protein [Oscillospiraceae bacterium]